VWALGSRLAAGLAVLSSGILLFSLLRLSFSGLSAVFFDTLVPRYPTLRAYGAVLLEEGLLRSLANTLLLALPVALAVPAVTLPAAAALWGWRSGGTRRRGQRRDGNGGLAILGVQLLGLVTGMHAIVPLYVLVRRLGLVGSPLPIVAVYTAHAAPFALLSLRAAFRSLPASLADVARAEGMGPWGYLARVLVPLLAPVLLVIGAVGFLGAWNGFLVPLVFLTDDARYPVSVKLFSLVGSIGSASPRWNLFAAGSVVNLVVVGVLTAAIRRPMGESVLSLGVD
jgi:multiple sugar transport system permease protein